MRFTLYKEKAGVIDEKPVWLLIDKRGYLYDSYTLLGLIKTALLGWKSDKYMVG